MKVVETIANKLGETEKGPLKIIERVVTVLGEERTLALVDEALKIEAQGGMRTDDAARRRTPGGIFFKLIKNQTTSRQRWTIFDSTSSLTPKSELQPISWEESEALSNEALQLSKGEAFMVKATIIGRPGRIIEKEDLMITTMENNGPPSLPKSLPQPPNDPTTYIVYIAMKQWRKVRQSLKNNPDDKLIIEGYPVFDRRIGEHGTMTVFAQSATTKLLQQAQREKQKAAVSR